AFFLALHNVQFGARYTDKSKERNRGERNIKWSGEGDESWAGERTLADSELEWVTDIVLSGKYEARDLAWKQVTNDYARDTFRYPGFSTPFDEGEYYRVDEEATALYAMADFNFDLGRFPIFINAGARYVDTSVVSFGYHPIQNPDGTPGFTEDPVS